ncbi:MAG: DUF4368 domain-containing protein [Clostridiales Family XIII bacterium]|nr:DUF4368 domain-containing protein [Clostridiales Family XIII bacterium]
MARLATEVERYNADTTKAERFIAIVKRHTDITAFSATLLNDFVENAIVHEAATHRIIGVDKSI